jgi:hypothetical protein
MSPARVTVVMPVYNAARYLDESIGSLQAQTFADWELLAIDDGSTDDSAAVLESFAARDTRVRVLANGHNRGLSSTRNRGLEEAGGEYLAWLDADDIAAPRRLEKQVRFLDRHRDFGMVGSWVEEIDAESRPNGRRWILNAPPECVSGLMLFRCYCAQSAMLLRRAEVGAERYDEAYPPGEDYEFNARLARRLRMWNLPEILCLYRRHAASTSTVQGERALAALHRLFRAQLAELNITPSEAELALHTRLFDVRTRGGASLPEAQVWLCRLWQANEEKQVYVPPAFARVLVTQWLYVCLAAPGPLRTRVRDFTSAKILRLTALPPGQWFGLLSETLRKAWCGRGRRPKLLG